MKSVDIVDEDGSVNRRYRFRRSQTAPQWGAPASLGELKCRAHRVTESAMNGRVDRGVCAAHVYTCW